jgi:flagellar hook-associated protein 3 FlgL
MNQLVQIGNSQDANGDYLFSGFSSRTQPFVQTAGAVAYAGDQGQRVISVAPGETIATGDAGSAVFQQIPSGNGTFAVAANATNTGTLVAGATTVTNLSAWDGGTYSIQFTAPDTYQVLDSSNAVVSSGSYSGDAGTIAFKGVQIDLTGTPKTGDTYSVGPSTTRDVFATIKDIADALDTPVANGTDLAALNERINRALDNLDQASSRLLETQAGIGARMNVLDQQKTVNAGTAVQLKATLSGVQDIDYASAASRLSQQSISLQAAQQSFVKVQGLSLFNFLR